MKEPPRSTKESLFSKDLVIEILILGITITTIVFATWLYLMHKNVDIVYARSVIMMLMVFIQNINVLNCISEKTSIFEKNILSNIFIPFTVIGSILLQLLVSVIPITAKFLKIVPLSIPTTIRVFILSWIIILVFEIYKLFFKKENKNKKIEQ